MSTLTDRIDPYTMDAHGKRVRPAKRSPRERFRLALYLLRQYEREEANDKTLEERYEILHTFAERIKEGQWALERRSGTTKWREAVERHASQFRLPEEAK